MMVKKGYKETILGIMPEDWDIKQVQGIGKIVTGTTPSTKKDEYYGNKYKFITPSDINDSKYIRETERYLSEEGLNVSRPIPENSVMVTCIASIGKNAITREKACTNQQINSIVCKDDIEANYVYYSMNYRARYLRALSGKTAVPIVNKGEFSTFLLPLPSYIEQKKIADILSTVDENIEKTERMIEKTKELKKGLMQQLLTKGIGHSEFKEVRIGPKAYEIPKEWPINNLDPKSRLTKKVTDGAHHSPSKSDKGKFYYATVTNLSSNGIDFETCNKINEENYNKLVDGGCKPEINDVLFSKDGTVGISAVFNDKHKVVLLSSIAIIRTTNNINSYYLKYFLSSRVIKDQIKSFKSGTAIRRVVLRDIKKFKIILPPLEEQKKIADILFLVDKKIQKEEEYKENLQKLKKGLMQKLLTGEVRANK